MTYSYDCEREWDVDNVHVEFVDDDLRIYITEGGQTRMMVMPADDNSIMELDAGTSPIGWEDGCGHEICFGNSIPTDSEGDPMLWISVDVRGGDEHLTYYQTEEEAVDDAQESWDRLSDSQRRAGDSCYAARILSDYPWTGDLQDIVWDSRTAIMDVRFFHKGESFILEVPYDTDVWRAIERYDNENGTDFWDRLGEDDIDFPVTERDRGDIVVETWQDVEDAMPPEEVSADLQIGVSGDSLILRITQQAKMLRVARGEIVNVTIRRKD